MPRVAHRSLSFWCRPAISDFVIRYTDFAGSDFLSADIIPVTSNLSPTPISVRAAGTAALRTGFSGGTRLYSVLSVSETFSSPSAVFRNTLVESMLITSPVTTEFFGEVDGVCAIAEKEKATVTIRVIKKRIGLRMFNKKL